MRLAGGHRFELVAVGALEPRKAPDLLCRAFARARALPRAWPTGLCPDIAEIKHRARCFEDHRFLSSMPLLKISREPCLHPAQHLLEAADMHARDIALARTPYGRAPKTKGGFL